MIDLDDFPTSLLDRGKILRSLIEQPPAGRTGLHVFLEHFWQYIDSSKFIDGRPLHWMCEFYECWLKGEIRNGVLSAPPAMGKTIITNIAGPCYDWTARQNPEEKWLFGAFDARRLRREARRKITLLSSNLMRATYPEFDLTGKGGIEAFTNAHGGGMLSVTTGTMVTGWHCNRHVYDDLLNPFGINSEIGGDYQNALKAAYEWVFAVVETRMGDMAKAQRMMVMQRIHDEDPAGEARRKGWDDLSIDIFYEPPSDDPGTPYHFGPWTVALDDRTEPGENAWPARYPAKELDQKKENLGPAKFNAQYRQRPTTAEGGLLKRAWLHAYETRPNLKYARICQSWDAARKGTKESHSRVASVSIALFKDVCYILQETIPKHLDYVGTKEDMAAAQLIETYAMAQTILIEDHANGTVLINDLKTRQPHYQPPPWTSKIEPYEPGSKDFLERMNPFLDRFRAGRVLIPSEALMPSVQEWIDEMVRVPSGLYNDRWDVISQGLAWLVSGGIANYSAALKTVEKWL